jgi:hypothetical protein
MKLYVDWDRCYINYETSRKMMATISMVDAYRSNSRKYYSSHLNRNLSLPRYRCDRVKSSTYVGTCKKKEMPYSTVCISHVAKPNKCGNGVEWRKLVGREKCILIIMIQATKKDYDYDTTANYKIICQLCQPYRQLARTCGQRPACSRLLHC